MLMWGFYWLWFVVVMNRRYTTMSFGILLGPRSGAVSDATRSYRDLDEKEGGSSRRNGGWTVRMMKPEREGMDTNGGETEGEEKDRGGKRRDGGRADRGERKERKKGTKTHSKMIKQSPRHVQSSPITSRTFILNRRHGRFFIVRNSNGFTAVGSGVSSAVLSGILGDNVV